MLLLFWTKCILQVIQNEHVYFCLTMLTHCMVITRYARCARSDHLRCLQEDQRVRLCVVLHRFTVKPSFILIRRYVRTYLSLDSSAEKKQRRISSDSLQSQVHTVRMIRVIGPLGLCTLVEYGIN
jgi:hypothetical protein